MSNEDFINLVKCIKENSNTEEDFKNNFIMIAYFKFLEDKLFDTKVSVPINPNYTKEDKINE